MGSTVEPKNFSRPKGQKGIFAFIFKAKKITFSPLNFYFLYFKGNPRVGMNN